MMFLYFLLGVVVGQIIMVGVYTAARNTRIVTKVNEVVRKVTPSKQGGIYLPPEDEDAIVREQTSLRRQGKLQDDD